MRKSEILATALAFAALPAGVNATTIADPTGDFLATYTGPLSSDLDIASATATFDGSSFSLSSTSNGSIGATSGSLFVWGINRGSGTARLAFGSPSLAADVLFDAVVVMFPDGTLRVVTLPLMGPPTINAFVGGATIGGQTISAMAPLSLLFSTGFAPEDYTFTLWSRARVNPLADGTNAEIADFAPGRAGFVASAVPEPATWLSMLLGFGLVGSAMRLRRRAGGWMPSRRTSGLHA